MSEAVQVTFRFTGVLRAEAGLSSLRLSFARDTTLRGALVDLRARVLTSFGEKVLDPFISGDPPLSLLLLNRVHLATAADLDREICDADVVAFVLPMEGG